MSDKRTALVSGAMFVLLTGVMLRWERVMKAAGGQGMVAFELAGTPTRAAALTARWGVSGRKAARASLRWDFAYMGSYGALLASLLRWRFGRAMPALPVAAVALDAAEGVLLLRYLATGRSALPPLATVSAGSKFAVLAVALVRLAAGSRRSVRGTGRAG